MDNSQNVFSSDSSFSSHNSSFMESESNMEMLLLNIKGFLSKNTQDEENNPTFFTKFTSILVNCQTYISQNLEFIHTLLESLKTDVAILCKYINDINVLVQTLTAFIKRMTNITCSNMIIFPSITGDIIMLIFSHCKESEALYGKYLHRIEKELKDLFRSCHELQMTYLVILEKHFVFDLTDVSQENVLIEALDLNLKISKVVESLDAKTMAEQWKGFTAICEKYSHGLMDKNVVTNSTKYLCALIENNINTARQNNPDERLIVRSLKIANFSIKILMKMCTIFKRSTKKDYNSIMELLLLIHLSEQDTGLGSKEETPLLFKKLISSNVINLSNTLLSELLVEENFQNYLVQYDIVNIKHDEKLVGYIILLISAMRCVMQKTPTMDSAKEDLIHCLFKLLPLCQVWFNIDLRFKTNEDKGEQTLGLYEHLLEHTVAFALTVTSEQYRILEEKMYNSLLATDYCGAVFSSDLWFMLASTNKNDNLLSDQVSQLCEAYIQLEQKSVAFKYSPQQLHMRYAISRLFDLLPVEMRLSLYEGVISESDTLRILLLDEQMLNRNVLDEGEICRKFQDLAICNIKSSRDIDQLIYTMGMIAKFPIQNNKTNVESSIEKLWMKLCPEGGGFNNSLLHNVTLNNLWYLELLKSLTTLTVSRIHILQDNTIRMVLHVISSTLQNCNMEVKYVLVNPLCEIAAHAINTNGTHVADIFKHLLNSDCKLTTDIVCFVLQKHINRKLQHMIAKLKKENHKIDETWDSYTRSVHSTNEYWKEQLCESSESEFLHKCLKADDQTNAANSDNGDFDFGDIDSLFGDDMVEEPQTKKLKFSSEADDIVDRMIRDVELLFSIKEKMGVECKRKFKKFCDMCNKIN